MVNDFPVPDWAMAHTARGALLRTASPFLEHRGQRVDVRSAVRRFAAFVGRPCASRFRKPLGHRAARGAWELQMLAGDLADPQGDCLAARLEGERLEVARQDRAFERMIGR